MDNVVDLPEVQRDSTSVHDLHPDTAPTHTLSELTLDSYEDVVKLMTRYMETDVPRDPGDVFMMHLTQRRDAYFLQVGDIGLIYFTQILPEFQGQINIIFWDKKLSKDRASYVKEACQLVMDQFELIRIAAAVPLPCKPVGKLLLRAGFQQEGYLRKALVYDGTFVDVELFSLMKEDINGRN